MAINIENPKRFFTGVGTSALLLGSAGLAAEAQANTPAETLPSPGERVLVWGENNNPNNSLNVQMLLIRGANLELARQSANGLIIPKPMQDYANNFRVFATTPVADIECNQILRACQDSDVRREIKNAVDSGFIPHLTIVLAKNPVRFESSGGGGPLHPGFETTPSIYSNYCTVLIPEDPAEIHRRLIAHECDGHALFKLADARLVPGRPTNVGRGYANCSRTPAFWGWKPTAYKGCDGDTEAYINNPFDIMGDSGDPYFADETIPYIRTVMDRLRFGLQMPEGKLDLMGGSFSRIQTSDNVPLYQLNRMGLTIDAKSPLGTTQIQLKGTVTDGPGIHYIGNPGVLTFNEPQIGVGNYRFLPDQIMTVAYSYSDAKERIEKDDDPRWSYYLNPYTGEKMPIEPIISGFRFPKRFSDGITALSPANGETINTPQAVLRWANRDLDVFYYEVRASADCEFRTNPDKAVAPVWHNLIHGGLTKPLNSWETPKLELGREYCWQSRPRVQGDGTPVEWSETFRFNTPASPGLKSVWGVAPDQDYGNGIIGPSKTDYERANSPG